MKKLIFFILLISINAFSQTPNWQWAKGASGTSNENAFGVATDLIGNVYITGYFQSPTITFGSFTLTNAGSDDIYLVKYDSAGNVLWARRAGGTGIDDAYAIATDLQGNVFITGMFSSPFITFDTVTITNLSGADMYIVKYDSTGNALWARNSGGTGYQAGLGITTDNVGSVYVTGAFVSPTISFNSTILNNAGRHDLFLVKYDSNGNLTWANRAGGVYNDMAASVATDTSGNVFVSGNFESPSLTFGTVTITKTDTCQMFIVKYNSAGTALWATNAGKTNPDDINSMATDKRNNVYVVGNYSSHTMTIGSSVINNAGNDDWYIFKFNTGGNVIWARSVGGINNDDAFSVTADKLGNIYVAGDFFSRTINIGTTTLTNTSTGFYDACVAKFDSTGNVLWATSAGGTLSDYACSIATDAFSNAYILGTFGSTSIGFGNTTLSNSGATDLFIAKIDTTLISIGINEINKKETGIRIFPNPFNSQTTIWFTKDQENAELIISDVLGNAIKKITFSGKQVLIHKDEMKDGIYFVQITDKNRNVVNGKLIIQ